MKINELLIRPSSFPNKDFSIYWIEVPNKARVIFHGAENECYLQKKKLRNLSDLIWNCITKNFTEEIFDELNINDNAILQINIGALCFEFTCRDFNDEEGLEVNCECFILGEEGYGLTSSYNHTKSGIPYNDDFCLNYYRNEDMGFEKRRDYIQTKILEFIVLSNYIDYAFEEELTWDSITLKGCDN